MLVDRCAKSMLLVYTLVDMSTHSFGRNNWQSFWQLMEMFDQCRDIGVSRSIAAANCGDLLCQLLSLISVSLVSFPCWPIAFKCRGRQQCAKYLSIKCRTDAVHRLLQQLIGSIFLSSSSPGSIITRKQYEEEYYEVFKQYCWQYLSKKQYTNGVRKNEQLES